MKGDIVMKPYIRSVVVAFALLHLYLNNIIWQLHPVVPADPIDVIGTIYALECVTIGITNKLAILGKALLPTLAYVY